MKTKCNLTRLMLGLSLLAASTINSFAILTNAPAGPGDLLISEFRLRGASGPSDEYIEIYNNSDKAHNVTPVDGSSGYALVASDGLSRFLIPDGTVIPPRGHFLAVNMGYSLTSYPAGSDSTAKGDVVYLVDIGDNQGIALFNSSTTFIKENRIDTVGSSSETNSLYRSGNGYPAILPSNLNCAFYRDLCSGCPKNTFDNASNFVFVDPEGIPTAAGQHLGAPGPEGLLSPIQRNGDISILLFDTNAPAGSHPNVTRSFVATNNASLGNYTFRRKIKNNTGAPITRLRFRIVSLSTFPQQSGLADLRPRSCGPSLFFVTNNVFTFIPGTTLETPPNQPYGGGLNSTLSADTVSTNSPLPAGGTMNIQFVLGVQEEGTLIFAVDAETTAGASGNGAPKYLAALQPQFTLTGLKTQGSDVHVHFNSTAGALLNLQSCPDLSLTNWQNVVTNITAIGGDQWVTNSGVATQPQRFYRLNLPH